MSDSVSHRIWTVVKPVLIALFIGYFGYLLVTKNLKGVTWNSLTQSLGDIHVTRLALACGLTVLNYVILTGYDLIAVRYLRHPLSFGRVAFASCVGYAFSHNFGWIAGGGSVRYRLYSAWGFSSLEIAKLIATLVLTFWSGVFFLAGMAFVIRPPELPPTILEYLPAWLPVRSAFPLGVASLAMIVGYLILCAVWHQPLKLGKWEFTPPPFGLSVIQIVVASLDQLAAASVFYVLLPTEVRQQMSFVEIVNVYLLFTVVAAALHIPGGVVVLEQIVLDFIDADKSALTATLVAYRVIFYLLPLVVAGIMFLAHEWHARTPRPVDTKR